jgi:hypothetical protein
MGSSMSSDEVEGMAEFDNVEREGLRGLGECDICQNYVNGIERLSSAWPFLVGNHVGNPL